jgi:AcrR family transcriptional regulator
MTHATRERLILAAERLFAERGIGGVSLREIGTAAGQRNNSAAQYHFDTKEGLVGAVYEFRMRSVNERRLALVQQIERDSRTEDRRALIEALVHPFAESLSPGSYYARFQAQVWADGVHAPLLAYELKGMEGIQRVMTWLDNALGEIPQPLRNMRLMLMSRFMIVALADYERELQRSTVPAPPVAAVIANIVDMMVAMVSAPISPATARELQTGAGSSR